MVRLGVRLVLFCFVAAACSKLTLENSFVPGIGQCNSSLECPFGLTCTEDRVCWDADDNQLPREQSWEHPGHAVAVAISVGAIMSALTLWYLIMFCELPYMLVEYGEMAILGYMLSLVAAFLTFCMTTLWLSLMLTSASEVVLTDMGTGAECTYLRARACLPYVCDVSAGACYESCSSSAACTLGYMCDVDAGVCVPYANQAVPVPWWGGVITGLLVFCICGAIVFASTVVVVKVDDNYVFSCKALKAMLVGVLVVCVLPVALPLALKNPDISLPDDVPIEGRSSTSMDDASDLAISMAFIVFACCVVVCGLALKDMDDVVGRIDGAWPAATCCILILCSFVGLSIFLGASVAVHEIDQVSTDSSKPCYDSIDCAPYVCIEAEKECADHCTDDDHCAGPYQCVDSVCTVGFDALVFSIGAGFTFVVGVAVCCGATAAGIRYKTFSRYSYDKGEKMMAACVPPFFLGVIVASAIAGGVRHDIILFEGGEPDLADIPCSVPLAAVCEPFVCNVASGRCAVECFEDTECSAGAVCRRGDCVTENTTFPAPLYSTNKAWLTALCTMGALWALAAATCAGFMGMPFKTKSLRQISLRLRFDENAQKRTAVVTGVCTCMTPVLLFVIAMVVSFSKTTAPDFKSENVIDPGTVAGIAIAAGLFCVVVYVVVLDGFLLRHADDYYFHPVMGVVGACVIFTIGSVGTGLAVGLPQNYERYDPASITSNVTCVGPFASICAPFACDVVTETCLLECARDGDCQPGHHCFQDERTCARVTEEVLFLPPNMFYPVVAGVALASTFFFWGCMGGCSFGIDKLAAYPGSLAYMLFVALVLSLFYYVFGAKYPVYPSVEGSGDYCTVPNDVTCAPFRCDTLREACLTSCTTFRDCTTGYMCRSDGTCGPEDDVSFLAVACVAVGVFVCVGYRTVKRRLHLMWLQRLERKQRAVVAERKMMQEEIERKKDMHKVFIDVLPAHDDAKDYSMPTPATYALDPGFNAGGGTFEAAIDRQLTQIEGEAGENTTLLSPEGQDAGFPDQLSAHLPDIDECEGGEDGKNGQDCVGGSMSDDPNKQAGTNDDSSDADFSNVRIVVESADKNAPDDVAVNAGGKDGGGNDEKESKRRPVPAIVLPDNDDDGEGDDACVVEGPTTFPSRRPAHLSIAVQSPGGEDMSALVQKLSPEDEMLLGSDGRTHLVHGTCTRHPSPADAPVGTPSVEVEEFPAPSRLPPAVQRIAKADVTSTPEGMVLIPRHTEDDCSICFADEATVRFAGRACTHGYCDDCARTALETIHEMGQYPARCPGCREEHGEGDITNPRDWAFIPSNIIESLAKRTVLSVAFARRFVQQQVYKAFPETEVVVCPVCDMLNIMTRDAASAKERSRKAKWMCQCSECDTVFCCKCNVLEKVHKGLSCAAVAKKQKMTDDDIVSNAYVQDQIKNGAMMRCPAKACGLLVVHSSGCNWMQCSCGMEICWATKKPRHGPDGCGGGHNCH